VPTTVHDRKTLTFDLEFKMRLNALSVALQDVAEASHPSPEILNVVEARH